MDLNWTAIIISVLTVFVVPGFLFQIREWSRLNKTETRSLANEKRLDDKEGTLSKCLEEIKEQLKDIQIELAAIKAYEKGKREALEKGKREALEEGK